MKVGGVDLVALPLEQLRTEVALVTQEHHVFVGTVRDNIVLAREGLGVEHRGGDLSERDPALGSPGTDEEGDHARDVERDVDDAEQQVAQGHRVALGLRRHRDVVVAGAAPAGRRAPSASTVRAPSVVSVSVVLIREYVAPSVM